MKTSAVYIFDNGLKEVGCDRNAFHKSSIYRKKGRVLMEHRENFGKIQFLEMKNCLFNCIWTKIHGTRETIISNNDITLLKEYIELLKKHWCCKRDWEKNEIKVTPKWHLLFYHMEATLTKFCRICHMTEDPIKKTHAENKNLERNFASIQKTKDREEAKGRVRQLK